VAGLLTQVATSATADWILVGIVAGLLTPRRNCSITRTGEEREMEWDGARPAVAKNCIAGEQASLIFLWDLE
jgi:hypothetical protein